MLTPARRGATALLAAVLATAAVLAVGAAGAASAARPAPEPTGPTISWTLTRGDGRALLAPQTSVAFGKDRAVSGAVSLDPARTFQSHVGVGVAVTESAAVVLGRLSAADREAALRSVFDPVAGAGVSLVRVPLGASDFALGDYTYDDLPPGETDEDLSRFSIAREQQHVLPLLREAARINPALEAVLAAWSAPAWMKSSGTTHGGTLLPAYEDVYARYLARAAQELTAAGLRVRAMSLVNEPGHSSGDYPTMAMDVAQQGRVAVVLRAELDARGLGDVGVLAHDHNWDGAASAVAALTGEAGASYSGAAFHCYGGDVSAQGSVVAAAPGTEVWTTECSGGGWSSSFGEDLRWGARNMVIGAFRYGSVATMWWNLALDPQGGPKNGGCQDCRGVLTVDHTTGAVTRNVELYSLAHVGRFVPRGSVRISTPERSASGIESVAYRTPEGRVVLVLLNDAQVKQTVTVRWDGRSAAIPMPGSSLATATW